MEQILKNRGIAVIFALMLVIGVAMALSPTTKDKQTSENAKAAVFNEGVYESRLEERLKNLIEQIDGVGSVSVMITLEGSALCTYAQNSSENVASDGDVKKETNIVLSTKSASIKEAVVSGYTMPKIKGAAVVCKNKLSAVMLEKVIGTVSASLGISTDKIYVTN